MAQGGLLRRQSLEVTKWHIKPEMAQVKVNQRPDPFCFVAKIDIICDKKRNIIVHKILITNLLLD